MELKMKYNYSYFIYPYVIKNYNKYVQRLLDSQRYTPKYFEREKNLSIYNYFLPSIRDYMFKSFSIAKRDVDKPQAMEEKMRQNMFKQGNCIVFEYNIGEDMQAKTVDGDRYFL